MKNPEDDCSPLEDTSNIRQCRWFPVDDRTNPSPDILSGASYLSRKTNNGLPLKNGCKDNWTWDENDRSIETRLTNLNKTAHFHPNWSNGTAGVRGTKILDCGRYYWEINVSKRIFGTSMMFGIGTKQTRLHVDKFINMIGEDEQSWGLSHKGRLWHNGAHTLYTNPFRENVATIIGIYFDGIAGTLTYFKDHVNLGVAFKGLENVSEPLYPIICSTAAKTTMSLGGMRCESLSLQELCRCTILKNLSAEGDIDQLLLPDRLERFIADGISEATYTLNHLPDLLQEISLNDEEVANKRSSLSSTSTPLSSSASRSSLSSSSSASSLSLSSEPNVSPTQDTGPDTNTKW